MFQVYLITLNYMQNGVEVHYKKIQEYKKNYLRPLTGLSKSGLGSPIGDSLGAFGEEGKGRRQITLSIEKHV